jgi:hypothetical protein
MNVYKSDHDAESAEVYRAWSSCFATAQIANVVDLDNVMYSVQK